MLRISKLSDYGTVIMSYMARDPERVYSAGDVALRTRVAQPTVSKVMKMLARGALVTSQRGARGGYVLARAPSEISMAQIIDAIEGPIGLTECSSMPGLCEQEPSCQIRANWRRINHAVRHTLDGITLADMAQPRLHLVEVGAVRWRHRAVA